MAYILSKDLDDEIHTREALKRLEEKWKKYADYLESVREHFPKSAFEFATAPWLRRFDDHRCPHDSWVESLTIREPSSGERHEHRSLEIEVRLLGAYHDGHMTLSYREVQSYSLAGPPKSIAPHHVGHSDWLYDEVTLTKDGCVCHEIEFSCGGRWLIECKDIDWVWEPLENNPVGPS